MSQASQAEEAPRKRRFQMPPAFRYPAYRAYWLGTLASVGGFQMLTFGQGWLTFEETGSEVRLGFVLAANGFASIALNLFGGVLADRLDKRRLIITTQLVTAALIFLLATLVFTGVIAYWHIVVIALFSGATNAFDQPARQALYPHLIDRKVMVSAVALNSAVWQGTRIVAPGVAGFMIGQLGTASSLYMAGSGFVVMAMVIFWLHVPKIETVVRGSAAQNLLGGLKFIAGDRVFSFLIGMTFFNSFFGMAYVAMMPVFTVDVLGVGAEKQGLLMSVGGIGALGVTMLLGARSNFAQKELLIIGGAVVFGVSVAAFALTAQYVGNFYLAMALIVIMGISSSAYMISIMSSLQILVPNDKRGRVMGFYGMTWSIMPLGALWAGVLGDAIDSVPWAIAIGGLLVSGFAVGPALVNKRLRSIGTLLQEAEQGPVDDRRAPDRQTESAPTAGAND